MVIQFSQYKNEKKLKDNFLCLHWDLILFVSLFYHHHHHHIIQNHHHYYSVLSVGMVY